MPAVQIEGDTRDGCLTLRFHADGRATVLQAAQAREQWAQQYGATAASPLAAAIAAIDAGDAALAPPLVCSIADACAWFSHYCDDRQQADRAADAARQLRDLLAATVDDHILAGRHDPVERHGGYTA